MEDNRNTDTNWHKNFQDSFHSEAGGFAQRRQKVFDEYPRWYSRLRNSRLAVRVERLWRMLLEGSLTRKEMAVVIAALLYCITPFDLTPDFLPAAGYVDDLLVVVSVLAYLEHGQGRNGHQ